MFFNHCFASHPNCKALQKEKLLKIHGLEVRVERDDRTQIK